MSDTPRPESDDQASSSFSTQVSSNNSFTITVPLTITVRLGSAISTPDSAMEEEGRVAESRPSEFGEEAISIDPKYDNRKGYDPIFLGTGNKRVPLPELSEEMKANVAINQAATDEDTHVLPYHHYSVVMNKERRLAYFTAVNIDGGISYRIKRDPDRWIYDPRIEKDEQTGNEVYADNPLDRGHLVRRLDPAWGKSEKLAKVANDDTFHYTNCSPQHKDFNQNQSTWAGLEDYILNNAGSEELRVSVFSGPVFGSDDAQYRGVLLPKEFWKVVVMVKENGKLSATGYLLSQEGLIENLEEAAFAFGAYKTFQVPVSSLETTTGLSFGNLSSFDPIEGLESVGLREVKTLDQIVL
jgi:endonuclease G